MQENPILSGKPRCQRWLIALALLLAFVTLGTVWQVINVPVEPDMKVSIPRPLDAAAGAGWAVIFVLAAWTLLRRHPRGAVFLAWAIIGFLIYSLGRLAVFARADYDRQRLPFLVLATIIVMMAPVAYLIRFHSTEKLKHGRKPKN